MKRSSPSPSPSPSPSASAGPAASASASTSPGRAAQEMADTLQDSWSRAVADPAFQEACGVALALQGRAAREARRLAATWLHAWGLPTVDDVRQSPQGRNA